MVLTIAATVLFSGCASREYESRRACIYDRKIKLLRHGFRYRLYYRFVYGTDTVTGRFAIPKMGQNCRPDFAEVGDTVVVKFPQGKPRKNEVVSVIKTKI